MKFEYVRDPLFVACLLGYSVNRFILKHIWDTGFLHDHLNDLICVPLVVPATIWAQRRLGFRKGDSIPCWHEVLVPVLVLSITFEILLPLVPPRGSLAVADHLDVLFYITGGLAACLFWCFWYGQQVSDSTKH